MKKALILGRTKYKFLILILLVIFLIFNNFTVYFDLEIGINSAPNLNIISSVIYLVIFCLCLFLLDIKYSFIYATFEIIFPFINMFLKDFTFKGCVLLSYDYINLAFRVIVLVVLILALTNKIKNKLLVSYCAFTLFNVVLANLMIDSIGQFSAFSITHLFEEIVYFGIMIVVGIALDEQGKEYSEERYNKIMISATSIPFAVFVICMNVNMSLVRYLGNTGKALMTLIFFVIAICSMLYAIKPTLQLYKSNSVNDKDVDKICSSYITENIDLFFGILVIGLITTLYALVRCIILNVILSSPLNMIAYVGNFIIVLLFVLMCVYVGRYYMSHKNDKLCVNESSIEGSQDYSDIKN